MVRTAVPSGHQPDDIVKYRHGHQGHQNADAGALREFAKACGTGLPVKTSSE